MRADLINLPIITTYGINIATNLNATDLSPAIDESLATTKANSLIIGLAFIILIAILIIPLGIAFRKRLPRHEEVFDIIVSVEVELIALEIKSLNYIVNILKHYQDSN